MSRSRRASTRPPAAALTHVGPDGRLQMVDVTAKAPSAREAIATGAIRVNAAARRLVASGGVKKGNAIEAARLAGIMAAKKTAELIPLCHSLPLSHVAVDIRPVRDGFAIEASVRTTASTGVEMEALTAVAAAALTLYDMLKAVDRAMVIDAISLREKRGGRSGEYRRGRS
jgi:cyclic pyranopterin phosphate synthase